ncbi:MAG TPA: DinB family protein [Burkholderiaceae bacterium]|nr:DinB family protein [Burkholderiaceae bacterium]
MNAIIDANVAVLRRHEKVLKRMHDDDYQCRLDGVFGGSIGVHTRHILDHYACFFRGLESGNLDYENRDRDPELEANRRAAIAAITHVCGALTGRKSLQRDRSLLLSALSAHQPAQSVTSVHRELEFLLGHTLHHHSLLAVMCRLLGVSIEPGFGFATATLRHWARKPATAGLRRAWRIA